MSRAPGFGTRRTVLILTDIADLEIAVAVTYVASHIVFDVAADDHHDPAHTRFDRVAYSEVDERLTVGADNRELLRATEPRAETRRHNDQ